MRHGSVNNVMNNDQCHFEERVYPSRRSESRGVDPSQGRLTDSWGSRGGGLGTARALMVDVHMLRCPGVFLRVSLYITYVDGTSRISPSFSHSFTPVPFHTFSHHSLPSTMSLKKGTSSPILPLRPGRKGVRHSSISEAPTDQQLQQIPSPPPPPST